MYCWSTFYVPKTDVYKTRWLHCITGVLVQPCLYWLEKTQPNRIFQAKEISNLEKNLLRALQNCYSTEKIRMKTQKKGNSLCFSFTRNKNKFSKIVFDSTESKKFLSEEYWLGIFTVYRNKVSILHSSRHERSAMASNYILSHLK